MFRAACRSLTGLASISESPRDRSARSSSSSIFGHDRIEDRGEGLGAQPVPHVYRMALHVALQDIADHAFAQPSAPSADDVAIVQVLEILRIAFGDQVIQRRMDDSLRRYTDIERMFAGQAEDLDVLARLGIATT